MKRVLILVEGQTEERFVKDVLAPVFWPDALDIRPTLLITKRVKDGPNFKGGVTNFAKFENDIKRLLSGAGSALVTTILDYYKLPNDFPGMESRPPHGTPIERVKHVENTIAQHFNSPSNFLPFLALHEFETWLFSSTEVLPKVMTQSEKQPEFAEIRLTVNTPEEINERPGSAPSERIESLFPAYRKTLHGPIIAQRIGIAQIRAECQHFNEWITLLEKLDQS